ncbi:hypothetical protein QE152_g14060 [Popillia japonica]|uniref:Uncharacterized protein n=1 Tax=Popillia japonica TaxID=7064 RepID=A0AAW1LAM9_POPJA
MVEYISAVMSLVQQLADINHNVDDKEVAMMILDGLPSEVDPLIMGIEAIAHTTISTEMIKSRLLQDDYQRRNLENTSKKFWKIEELPDSEYYSKEELSCENHFDSEYYSKEELSCENHFETTFKREQDGRFTVSLPLKENHANLGESLGIAEKRLISMEKKFVRDSSLQGEYRRFMEIATGFTTNRVEIRSEFTIKTL